MEVLTDTWCSSGGTLADGTLVSTGGYNDGATTVRHFSPCTSKSCDWSEAYAKMGAPRWYASNQILPDNSMIVVGGRASFSYEFVPSKGAPVAFYFLRETNVPGVENNLYPFLHLSSDGNLFVFANKKFILLNYKTNQASAMASSYARHVFVFPFPTQSHANAAMDLSRKLALLGVSVTFVCMEAYISSMLKQGFNTGGLPIHLHVMPDGLIKEKSLSDTIYQLDVLIRVTESIGPVLQELLNQLNRTTETRVSCVVNDFLLLWVGCLSNDLHILELLLLLIAHTMGHTDLSDRSNIAKVPGFPAFHVSEVPDISWDPNLVCSFDYVLCCVVRWRDATGVLLNLAYKVEKEAVEGLKELREQALRYEIDILQSQLLQTKQRAPLACEDGSMVLLSSRMCSPKELRWSRYPTMKSPETVEDLMSKLEWTKQHTRRVEHQRVLYAQLGVKEENMELLHSALEERDNVVHDLEDELSSVKAQRDSLRKQVQHMSQEAIRLTRDFAELKQVVENLDDKLMLKEGEISILRDTCSEGDFLE
ncbi:hypothetical protein L7F22_030616 [Adiantum nelumboides]|nr:hypothetical protein [Adiantum nelumboides]